MDIKDLFNVKGKVVLVTGGGRGIGYSISQGFVTNGSRVYISSRNASACAKAAAELNELGRASGSGGSAVSVPADLQSLDECRRLASELTRREPGGLHVLVNNSGVAWGAPFDEYPDDAWTRVLTLNLQRAFTLTQLLAPLLEKAAGGGEAPAADPSRVIHIGSIDGLRVPTVSNFAYSASKAGLHHLSRALATELGPRGITSNVVACGPFRTKMTKAIFEQFEEMIVATSPAGRIGTPEDAAGACLFLASRAGAFVNGATIALDGGIALKAMM